MPEVGEIILRYGEAYAQPGDGSVVVDTVGVDDSEIEDLIRDTIREELQRLGLQPGGPGGRPAARCPAGNARRGWS